MIKLEAITNFKRTPAEHEEFVLFATMVPTKSSHRIAQTLEHMLANARFVYGTDLSPFDIVRIWIKQGILGQVLRQYGVGQYSRITRCWKELVSFHVVPKDRSESTIARTIQTDIWKLKPLEAIYGIGPKTARFIVLHSDPKARCIPIDTHWIKELIERGYPIQTEMIDGKLTAHITPARYQIYEEYALAEVDKSGLTCAEYDLQIWRKWNDATLRRAA